MLPVTMLSGPGLPEEAFAFDITNFFNQKPDDDDLNVVPMQKVDLNRSMEVIQFMQELASRQDELLVSVIKIIDNIEVGQGGEGSPAWDTVKTSVSKDYANIVEFCQAGLDKLAKDYPMEETDDNESD